MLGGRPRTSRPSQRSTTFCAKRLGRDQDVLRGYSCLASEPTCFVLARVSCSEGLRLQYFSATACLEHQARELQKRCRSRDLVEPSFAAC